MKGGILISNIPPDLQATLDFAHENNMSFIPVKDKDKKPLIPWKEFQKRYPSNKEINSWFKNRNKNNIGLICGSISGGVGKNLVVLDYDDLELFEKYHGHPDTNTRVVRTPNGYHEYFLLPETCKGASFEVEKSDGGIGRIDLKGEGGYVIAPPSVHPSGKKYEWVNKKPIIYLSDYTAEMFTNTIINRLIIFCEKEGWVFKNKKNLKEEVDIYDKYWDGGKPICRLIADRLINDFKFKTLIDTNEILFYDNVDGLYHYNGDKIIIRELQNDRFGEGVTRYWQNEIINKIQGKTFLNRDQVNNKIHLIHLKNGIYHLDSDELTPFNPSVISTVGIPVYCNPKAKCPRTVKFFKEVLPRDSISMIEETFGYSLYRKYFIHKATMLLGDGGNGKTTLINLLIAFLGERNISAIPLQALDKDKFAVAEFEGKLANLVADIPDKGLHQTGIFKSLTGNDFVLGERKFKPKFTFRNYANLIYSCNKLPESHDYTPAFFRRWNLITFPNVFYGPDDDKDLINKVTKENELSGLFNLAVKGLKRLRKNGDFTNSATVERVEEKWTWLSDSLKAFIETCIMEDISDFITVDDFNNDYFQFCRDKNLIPKAKNIVGQQIGLHVRAERSRKRIGKRQAPIYKGIRKKEVGEG